MITKTHYFFFLSPSPWPFLCSILSFNFLFSFLILFKVIIFSPLIVSLVFLSFCSFYWWFNYRGEINLQGFCSFNLIRGIKSAIILFIFSEVFFFFSFFWRYFHFLLSPALEIGASWPPANIISFDFLNVPLINTLILLSSGVTVTLSHYNLILNKKKLANFFLSFTIFLGLFFSYLQILEYSRSFFSLRDRNFGTSFFILTGFHGIHVLIGTIFLIRSLIRFFLFSISQENFLRIDLASWYWHFVDVVWIFLYFFLYYITT